MTTKTINMGTLESGDKRYKRNPTFELLRIIAMYLIVINHFAMFMPINFGDYNYNIFINYFLQSGGKFGVNLFILITGYFMCTSTFRLNKLVMLLLKCFIYSLGCYVVYCIITETFSIKNLISSCFPIISNEYWFMTAYVGVYILCPYINKLFHSLESTQRIWLTGILSIMLSVIPTFTLQNPWTSNFVWLAFLYWLGAVIRFDLPDRIKESRHLLLYCLILYFAIVFSCIVIDYLSNYYPVLSYHIGHFRNMTSFPLLVSSVLFFIWFSKKTISLTNKAIPVIMTLASGAFAVCLIHENPYVKKFLWGGVFSDYIPYGVMYLPYALLFSAIIYVVCTIVDLCISKIIDTTIKDKLSALTTLLESKYRQK